MLTVSIDLWSGWDDIFDASPLWGIRFDDAAIRWWIDWSDAVPLRVADILGRENRVLPSMIVSFEHCYRSSRRLYQPSLWSQRGQWCIVLPFFLLNDDDDDCTQCTRTYVRNAREYNSHEVPRRSEWCKTDKDGIHNIHTQPPVLYSHVIPHERTRTTVKAAVSQRRNHAYERARVWKLITAVMSAANDRDLIWFYF